jgi:hypothetical protein
MFQFFAATVNRLATTVKRPVDRLSMAQKPVRQGTCGSGEPLAGLIRTIGRLAAIVLRRDASGWLERNNI